jgi:hypothetical protein
MGQALQFGEFVGDVEHEGEVAVYVTTGEGVLTRAWVGTLWSGSGNLGLICPLIATSV